MIKEMAQEKIKTEIKKIIIKNTRRNVLEEDIIDTTLLIEDLEFDSINIISLIVDIEECFNVEFDDANLLITNINQFDKLVNYVEKLNKEKTNE
jgi:acyl carrier protein